MTTWTPTSWLERPVLQQPTYDDQAALDRTVDRLRQLPPLVTSWEVERLKQQLGEAAVGQRFLLQGGACAERFDQCRADVVTNKLKILLQMSLVLTYGLKRQIIRVGRFAGQYAKPRSSDTETRDGVTLPSYRGELVNGIEFDPETRRPDPERLLRGYEYSALTLNFIRALVEGGFADLHHPEYWDLDFVAHSPRAQEYQQMVETISDSLRFMETLAGIQAGQMRRVDFYTSHEALHLAYESAQTRRVPHRTGWYNLTTHLPWIGMRTADPGGAHVEYFRGIANPVGVKIGPGMTPEWLMDLMDVLDPDQEPGSSHPDPPPGPRPRRRGAADVHRDRPAQRPGRPVVLRPHARQHRDHGQRSENTSVRQHPVGAGTELRHPPPAGFVSRWRPLRAVGRQRDRVRRWGKGPVRGGPGAGLREPCRPAPELRAVSGDGAAHRAQDGHHEWARDLSVFGIP
jgi:3-deoxy-D-arabino-heptulosonate 7-phosphate (DAHP) synthase class II